MSLDDEYTALVYIQYVLCLGFIWFHLYYKRRHEKSFDSDEEGLKAENFRDFFRYRPLYINVMNTAAVVIMTFNWLMDESLCTLKDISIFFSATLLFLPLYSRVTVLYIIDKYHRGIEVDELLKDSDVILKKDGLISLLFKWFKKRHLQQTFWIDLLLYSFILQAIVLLVYFFGVDNSSCSESGCFFCYGYVIAHSVVLFLLTVFGLRSVYKTYDLHKELLLIAVISVLSMVVLVVYNVLLKDVLSEDEDQFVIVSILISWMVLIQVMLYLYPIWSWRRHTRIRKKMKYLIDSKDVEELTIDKILENENHRGKFEEFCKERFITESYVFLLLAKKIEDKKEERLGDWRTKLEPFFVDEGDYVLNIDSVLKQEMRRMLNRKDEEHLDTKIIKNVYNEISRMLTGDKLPEFQHKLIQEDEEKS